MAGDPLTLWKNDGTNTRSSGKVEQALPTAAALGWTRDGYSFVNWNTAADGSGTSYEAGTPAPAGIGNQYAQWAANSVDYIATSTDLTSVADAIRTKAGTSAQLVFPAGFVSAIRDIPSGGGGGSTLIEVSNFVGNVYYIDSADGVLKMQYRPMSSLSVPSGSMVVLHWNGPKPPDGVTLVNLSIVYSVSNGTKANYPATDFCIAS